MTKRRPIQLGPLLKLAAKRLLKNRLLIAFTSLCIVGYVVGMRSLAHPAPIPLDDLFESMRVLSYRDMPSDTITHFVVELSACGRRFIQYDIDTHRFSLPENGYHYSRAVTGTEYPPLKLRGHVDQGLWLELPDSVGQPILPSQFDELYRKTLDYVKPLSVATNVLGMLSGYSIGYRMGRFDGSLCNPRMRERLLGRPGLARIVAREAWRRVLLEPVLAARETDAQTFNTVNATQRIYAQFYRLALRDTDGFIMREVDRLYRAGQPQYARAMLEFASAIGRARRDGYDFGSDDFRAVEVFAGMLDSRGHWARYTMPAGGEARSNYLGALTYYGLAPAGDEQHRIWIGPRALVSAQGVEGYVLDDIPSTTLGCPLPWRRNVAPKLAMVGGIAWPTKWLETGSVAISKTVAFGRRVVVKIAPSHTTDAIPVENAPIHR